MRQKNKVEELKEEKKGDGVKNVIKRIGELQKKGKEFSVVCMLCERESGDCLIASNGNQKEIAFLLKTFSDDFAQRTLKILTEDLLKDIGELVNEQGATKKTIKRS